MATFWKKFVTAMGYVAASIIILAALLVSVTRLLTPVLAEHRPEFEAWASQVLKRPVSIGDIHIDWQVYEPQLVFNQVLIRDPKTKKPVFDIPQIKVRISLWRSVSHHTLMLEQLQIVGVHVSVRQLSNGQMQIDGLKGYEFADHVSGGVLGANEVITWIFSQPGLLLTNIEIDYQGINKIKRSVSLDKLILANNKLSHHLIGIGRLNQEVPTNVVINLHCKGDITHLDQISAELYLYLQGISLPQWLANLSWHGLQIKQGLGSAKIWATWNHHTWQTIQTNLQFYDLTIYSDTTHQSTHISRLNGHFGWKRDLDHQVIAGDNILIDFPDHLWPSTSFTVQYQITAANEPIVQRIHLGYIDLAQSYSILQAMGWSPAVYQTVMANSQLSGEIRDVNLTIRDNTMDFSHLSVSGIFNNIAIHDWDKWPAISHLSGAMIWDGQSGRMTLDSQAMSITLNRVFSKPLFFDQLSADIGFSEDNHQGWQLTANQVSINNHDIQLQANMTLNLPQNKSPTVDLTSQFKVMDASHVSDYLPVQLFAADLTKWLQNAFLRGELDQGSAILRGTLKDFPFDTHAGVFSVSGNVKHLDLNYAKSWPMIHDIEGKLLFTGRAMNIDVTSANLLDIPLKAVHAEIPYIGDAKPQRLSVVGSIYDDLSKGMQFIEKSPLQKIVGRHFSELQLRGPMQLDLTLSIPLKTPSDATVLGEADITNAELSLPEWEFALEKLKGKFQFTNKTISSTRLSGQLFNAPIVLTLSTKPTPDHSHQVIADLRGNLNMQTLAAWLKLPITDWALGTTAYQASLQLSGEESEPTLITIFSNLEGVSLTLPDGFSKTSTELSPLTLTLNMLAHRPLQLKFDYSKLLSGVISLEKKQKTLHFIGGELRIGGGPVNWSMQPGFLITGRLNHVNWSELQNMLHHTIKTITPSEATAFSSFHFDLLRGVDINIHTLEVVGMVFKDIRVQLTQSLGAIMIGLTNADLSGKLTWPLHAGEKIQARFDRLNLAIKQTGSETIDLSKLPGFTFIGDHVSYQNHVLGQVILDVNPVSNGMVIKQLRIESNLLKLNATGLWQHAITHLRGELTMPNVSELLISWGFDAKNLVESSGTMEFDVTWPGTFFKPMLQAMSGDISLALTKGRIIDLGNSVDAKMGIGRLLNLFSLQSIPRRLSLDFSDLFQKGYSFDEMKGDFTLDHGDAYTEDAYFDGPIARVDIEGHIGLAAKNYNMKLSVTPYVTASLPVVATFAVNPLVGAATWMVDKIVSHQVSKISTYQYTITGPWDRPIWQQENNSNKKP